MGFTTADTEGQLWDLSIVGIWYPQYIQEPAPLETKGQLYVSLDSLSLDYVLVSGEKSRPVPLFFPQCAHEDRSDGNT